MAALMTMADDEGSRLVPNPRAADFDYGSSAYVAAAPPSVAPATVSTHFKMIFLAVFSLTVALIIARVTVGIMVQTPSDSLKDAMATCNLLGNAGFGAILGLIGGKIS
jgi:hypothetical protein